MLRASCTLHPPEKLREEETNFLAGGVSKKVPHLRGTDAGNYHCLSKPHTTPLP